MWRGAAEHSRSVQVKTSEGAGVGWGGLTTQKWRNKKGQIGDLKVSVGMRVHVRQVTPGKGELQRTRVCSRPPPAALFSRDESVPSRPVNGSIDLYIHVHAGGARWRCTDTEPKADLSGWLTSPPPPLLLLLPLPVCFYSTQWNFSSAKPVTAAERQPVLSVLSAPAFSRLAEMPSSLLHYYPFIAPTIVFHDAWGRGES